MVRSGWSIMADSFVIHAIRKRALVQSRSARLLGRTPKVPNLGRHEFQQLELDQFLEQVHGFRLYVTLLEGDVTKVREVRGKVHALFSKDDDSAVVENGGRSQLIDRVVPRAPHDVPLRIGRLLIAGEHEDGRATFLHQVGDLLGDRPAAMRLVLSHEVWNLKLVQYFFQRFDRLVILAVSDEYWPRPAGWGRRWRCFVPS